MAIGRAGLSGALPVFFAWLGEIPSRTQSRQPNLPHSPTIDSRVSTFPSLSFSTQSTRHLIIEWTRMGTPVDLSRHRWNVANEAMTRIVGRLGRYTLPCSHWLCTSGMVARGGGNHPSSLGNDEDIFAYVTDTE